MKAAAPAASRLPFKTLLLILAGAATAYAAVLLLWGDRPGAHLAQLGVATGLQAAGLCLLSYLLRGARWRWWMARYGRPLGWRQGLRLYLAGYAFTPTPGNIGEAARGLMLAQQPLDARQSLAIFGAERLADLLSLLLLCLPALVWLLWQPALPAALERAAAGLQVQSVVVALTAAALLLAALTLLAIRWLARWRAALRERLGWLAEAWDCLCVQPLQWLALTLAAWSAQGLAMWLICRDLALDLPLLLAQGFYAVAMVAGALSALPAGLGGTEAVLAGLLVAYGAAPGPALAITVLVRLVTLWLAVAVGVVALLYSAAIRRDISLR